MSKHPVAYCDRVFFIHTDQLRQIDECIRTRIDLTVRSKNPADAAFAQHVDTVAKDPMGYKKVNRYSASCVECRRECRKGATTVTDIVNDQYAMAGRISVNGAVGDDAGVLVTDFVAGEHDTSRLIDGCVFAHRTSIGVGDCCRRGGADGRFDLRDGVDGSALREGCQNNGGVWVVYAYG
ncbi:MAG: hypothetical protein RLY87_1589 [Chloroflexota bacterium]